MRISASAKGVQCCLALTPWRLFISELGTDTHECAGELPLILAPMEIGMHFNQPVFPISAINMFQEPYLQYPFLYIQVYNFDAIICMLHGEEDHVLERHWPLTETFS